MNINDAGIFGSVEMIIIIKLKIKKKSLLLFACLCTKSTLVFHMIRPAVYVSKNHQTTYFS